MGQGTKRDIMLLVGWPWAPLTSVWKFEVMKKSTSASRNFWKVARMTYILILSGPNEFQKMRLENMALELIWNCRHDECQNLTAFLADISLLEGKMWTDIRETLTLLMCADCSPFLALFSPSEFFMHLVPMERLRAIAGSTWSRLQNMEFHITKILKEIIASKLYKALLLGSWIAQMTDIHTGITIYKLNYGEEGVLVWFLQNIIIICSFRFLGHQVTWFLWTFWC